MTEAVDRQPGVLLVAYRALVTEPHGPALCVLDFRSGGLTVPNRCSARFGVCRQRPFGFGSCLSPPHAAMCRRVPPGLLQALLHDMGDTRASFETCSIEVGLPSSSYLRGEPITRK